MKTALSSDGSVAALAFASATTTTIQVYQIAAGGTSCQLQMTLRHNHKSRTKKTSGLQDMILCGDDKLVGRFGTSELVLWDLNRGVVAHRWLAASNEEQQQEERFWGIATLENAASFYALVSQTTMGSSCKLQVHEYSTQTYTLQKKIKSGKWEGSSLSSADEDENDDTVSSYPGLGVCNDDNKKRNYLVVRTEDARMRVIDAMTGEKVGKLKDKKGGTAAGAMVTCGTIVAVPSSNGSIALFHAETCQLIQRIPLLEASSSTSTSSSQNVLVELSRQEDSLRVLVGGRSLYTIDMAAGTKQPAMDKPTLQLLSKSSSSIQMDNMATFLTSYHQVLLLYRSNGATPTLSTTVDLDDPAIKSKLYVEDLLLPESKEKADSATTETSKRKAVMMGPGQAGMEAAAVSKKSRQSEDDDDEVEDELSELDPNGITIADRLAQLSKELQQEDDDDDNDEEMEDDNANNKPPSFKPKHATTESLKELLTQALQSNDDTLLELALGVRDVKIIATTLQDVSVSSPSHIATLLHRLTIRLAGSPLRAEALVPWIATCLKIGTTTNGSNNGELLFRAQNLAPLRNLLCERVESFSEMLRLEGRLSIMCDTE